MTAKEYRSLKPKANKFGAVKCEMDGIKFDSKMELEYYQILKADPDIKHIDCHVPFTLPGGIRYSVDFVVWRENELYIDCYAMEAEPIEIKGCVTESFKIKRKLFNNCHPLRLKVLTKKGGKWIEI